MNKSLGDLVLEFFEGGKTGTVQDVVNFVQAQRPGTSYEAVFGTIRRAERNGRIIKSDRETYTLSADGEKALTEAVTVSTTSTKAPVEISVDGIHPMLERELTNVEKDLLEINAKKVVGVELAKEYQILAEQMRSGEIITAMFFGEPGNGKTTVARAIAHELKLPVYSQNFGLNSEETDIIGGFGPDDESEVARFRWIDGQFTKAFSEGGIYIAEELNYAKAGVLGAFNNALDGVGEIVLRNGKVLQRHPSFRFFSCMNVGLAGTQRMNLALINRMNKVMKFEPMPRHKQVEVIMRESGYTNRAVVKKMIDAGEAIRDKIKKEQIDGATISIRNLVNWAKDVKSTNSMVDSAWSTVIWAVCMEDDEVQQEIFDDIIKTRFDGVIA